MGSGKAETVTRPSLKSKTRLRGRENLRLVSADRHGAACCWRWSGLPGVALSSACCRLPTHSELRTGPHARGRTLWGDTGQTVPQTRATGFSWDSGQRPAEKASRVWLMRGYGGRGVGGGSRFWWMGLGSRFGRLPHPLERNTQPSTHPGTGRDAPPRQVEPGSRASARVAVGAGGREELPAGASRGRSQEPEGAALLSVHTGRTRGPPRSGLRHGNSLWPRCLRQ